MHLQCSLHTLAMAYVMGSTVLDSAQLSCPPSSKGPRSHLCLATSKGSGGSTHRFGPMSPSANNLYATSHKPLRLIEPKTGYHLSSSDQEQPPKSSWWPLGHLCRATGSWDGQRQSVTTLAGSHSFEPQGGQQLEMQEVLGLPLSSCVTLCQCPTSRWQ